MIAFGGSDVEDGTVVVGERADVAEHAQPGVGGFHGGDLLGADLRAVGLPAEVVDDDVVGGGDRKQFAFRRRALRRVAVAVGQGGIDGMEVERVDRFVWRFERGGGRQSDGR